MSADAAWAELTRAFAFYGKKVRPMRGNRREIVEKVLSMDYEPREFGLAVHGYVQTHDGLDKKPDGFDPKKFFAPENILRHEKLERRIELGEQLGPWKPVKRVSRAEERERKAEAEREANKQQVLAERIARAKESEDAGGF